MNSSKKTATLAEFDYVKYAYEEENTLASDLQSKAKYFITLQSAFLGAIVYNSTALKTFISDNSIPLSNLILLATLFAASLVLSFCVLLIQSYSGVDDPENLLSETGNNPDDDKFYYSCIVDLTVSIRANAEVNIRNAWLLQIAGWLIFAALLATLYLLLSLLYPRHLPILP